MLLKSMGWGPVLWGRGKLLDPEMSVEGLGMATRASYLKASTWGPADGPHTASDMI